MSVFAQSSGGPSLSGIFAGNPSDVFLKCLEEVQAISCATLFSPVTRQEAVQAMGENGGNYMREWNADLRYTVLVSGWSDNGWLSGGHAVRMAMELCKRPSKFTNKSAVLMSNF